MLIQFENVSYTVDGKDILRNVSFALQQGQITTVIGPNGAGKTTLLRLAMGNIKPTSGTIKRFGKLKLGYVAQKLNLNPLLPLRVMDFLKTTHTWNLEHLQHNFLCSLSGGELQRVLLAHAWQRQPNLLLLDEPTQGMDVIGQKELYQKIIAIKEELNCGILMVSHDLHTVLGASDQVICLNEHVCCAGEPNNNELLSQYIHQHDHKH